MLTITWEARGRGTVTPAPTAEHPQLYRLSAPGPDFETFDGSNDAGPRMTVTAAGTDYFALYLELTTNRGRRQFKFASQDGGPTRRFGYRYEVGLGRNARDGTVQSYPLDLDALADEVEPGTTIGSIDAVFVRVAGDLEIQVVAGLVQPPPPPGDPGGEMTPAEIVRFLNQTSFGATDQTIAAVPAAGGFEAWIDQQLDLPVSLTEPYVRAAGNSSNRTNRHFIWWQNLMEEPDQLRQRLAFAWSQIFVVSDIDYELANSQYGICNYYDMLATLADGNFRTLLERVTLHPTMGVYLSMVRNERADPERNVRPDENYAREILQLFTIGLYELSDDGRIRRDAGGRPIPTYDQTTVEEFAKVFTGWNFDGVRSWADNNVGAEARILPMVANETFHDRSAKTLLGGTVLPSGQSAYADLTMALDNIFAHPNVGPFVSRALIQRLVTSNPTPGYVGRVAAAFNNNGAGVRGDLRATVKALLLDPEARNGPGRVPDRFGKIKEPLLRLTNLWRAFDARPGPSGQGRYRPYARTVDRIEDVVGQAVMRSPSVFNFYSPDHPVEPGSDLVGPEMQILTEIHVAATNNMLLQSVYGDNNRAGTARQNVTRLQLEPYVALAADPADLLDRFDVLLCGGQLPSGLRAAIETLIAAHPDDDDGRYLRVVDAIYAIVGSPFHLVQK